MLFDDSISDWARKRTGLDCAFLLSVIHAFDHGQSGTRAWPFVITDASMLSTLREYVNSFSELYAINEERSWTDGWSVGRYAEDTYDGVATSQANPWHVLSLLF